MSCLISTGAFLVVNSRMMLRGLQVAALEGMATRQRDLMGGGGGASYANNGGGAYANGGGGGGGGGGGSSGATREGVRATAETLHTLQAQLQGGASSTARRTAALAAAARLRWCVPVASTGRV